MKLHDRAFLIVGLLLGLVSISKADLVDYGNGLIYDTDLNITWLQDANYAKTSGYPTYYGTGRLNFYQANAWAEQLMYGGFDDWRLPRISPVNGTSYVYDLRYDGSTDWGYNVSAPGTLYEGSSASEMSHLFYYTLGNKGWYNPDGSFQPEWGLNNTGPFSNLQAAGYWSGTERTCENCGANFFHFNEGYQDPTFKEALFFAIAVRDGAPTNVPVPEPSALLMAGLSILTAGSYIRRKFSIRK